MNDQPFLLETQNILLSKDMVEVSTILRKNEWIFYYLCSTMSPYRHYHITKPFNADVSFVPTLNIERNNLIKYNI